MEMNKEEKTNMFPNHIWILLAVSLLLSSIGFRHYIWFFSIGYGVAIAGEGLAMLLMYGRQLTVGTALCCAALILYGCRLGGYLAYRELKLKTYHENMRGEIKDSQTVPFGVKMAIWIACAALYVLQASPVFYRLHNASGSQASTYIGAVLMFFGIALEAAADQQKNQAKKKNPKRFVSTGLYRIVRCPNYLGEMILWTGAVISGIGSVHGGQWIIVILGYLGIAYVMFSGARRLEIRQNRNYGADPEYQQYVKTVPILIPFVPLYSVEKHKWLVA